MSARLRRNLFLVGVPLGIYAAVALALLPAVRRVREAAASGADL